MNLHNSFCPSQNLHTNLAKHNLARLAMNRPNDAWEADERCEFEYRILEGHYIEELRYAVKSLIPADFNSPDQFVNWFESLRNPLQSHSVYDWLANDAGLADMRWFLTQEILPRPAFADLLSLTQVSLPLQAKMECARNFWDEMGQGKQAAVHRSLLDRAISCLRLRSSIESTTWESLAYSNSMIALASTRRYAYQSLGALGMHELLMPYESASIAKGLKRLGMDQWVTSYFDLHAGLNLAHGRSWLSELIKPLVVSDPESATFLAEGALIRLYCARRCLSRYSKEFNLVNHFQDDFEWQHPTLEGLRLTA